MNPDWKMLDIEPMEIWIRDRIGISLDTDRLDKTESVARELLDNSDRYKAAIEGIISEYMYNIGTAAEVGGEYIINRVKARKD